MANKTNKKRKRKHQLRGITKQRKEDNIANSSTIRPTSTSGDDKRSVRSTVTNDTRTSSLSSDEEKSSKCMDVSASQTKIGNKLKSMDNENFDNQHCFLLVDSAILCSFLDANIHCKNCKQKISSKVCAEDVKGFCCTIKGYCEKCNCDFDLFKTSKHCKKEGVFAENKRQTPFEVNARMVAYAREIELGISALETLSKCVNSPLPIRQGSYDNLFDKYCTATKLVAEKSMKKAAQELLQQDGEDVMVSIDGTWQKRGHNSHNGVVTAVSVVSGRALDIEVLSNYCKGCAQWTTEQKKSDAYESWQKSHKCNLNHDGSAGAMEPVGAVKIFARSEAERGLRYLEYLGDGDSSSFAKVKESKPYGDTLVSKNECIGHVQKRIGTRLRKLCNSYKGQKLSDGKPINGKNRLTTKIIDTLQNYYGMAIRRNTDSLVNMVNAVLATLYHVASTDDDPDHGLCPAGEDSWCGWQRDSATYKHKHGLPKVIVELLEPIYEELSHPQLLSKCLHGKTQNPNECINKLIWSCCPKEIWVSMKTVQQASYAAVSHFNDGNISFLYVLQHLGVDPGYFTTAICRKRDAIRIMKSNIRSTATSKQRRKTLRAINKGWLDKKQDVEGVSYGKGAF